MGDMLDPDTDMLGEVAGELVENWNNNSILNRCLDLQFAGFDELTDLESVDNERIRTANNRVGVDQIPTADLIDKNDSCQR